MVTLFGMSYWLNFFSSYYVSFKPYGYLEYDINENDLRTKIVNPSFQIINGYLQLNENYGIGFQMSDNLNQFIDQFYEYRN